MRNEVNTRPDIMISVQDAERLEQLLATIPGNSPGKSALEEELQRADIVESHALPPTVVTMNSTVRFRVTSSGEEFCMTLVYPKDKTTDDTVSILAPVGSALLGLSEGDETDWPSPGGNLQVRIEEVTYQPERAGDLHR